jgi:hypothetical protein
MTTQHGPSWHDRAWDAFTPADELHLRPGVEHRHSCLGTLLRLTGAVLLVWAAIAGAVYVGWGLAR